MKKLLIFTLLILFSCNFLAFSQDVSNRKPYPDVPRIFIPKNHDPNYLKSRQLSTKSFYQSRSQWQHIIDSTWGPGDSLSRKLSIFNTYANGIHYYFDGFISLKVNWDSLYNLYLGKITASTSKGAFSAIMSHFAYDLRDGHTYAWDNSVLNSPLNPGMPILLIGGFNSVVHFGAVTTVLPDSTTLVLRVVPNHPLNLEPGDIILGYEGIPWKNLVWELLDAGLPMIAATGGCKSADTYQHLLGAGMNWHLFSTIDILKHSTGDTLHLSVLPLLNLNLPVMLNNEQMPIANISFPDILSGNCVTYGILENTNIGYIFLAIEVPEMVADSEFYSAVKELKNTEALIIDMRFNPGGWAFFDSAFPILFNEYYKTVEESFRCNSNTFDLCASDNWETFQIEGKGRETYDRPIAVLLGPSCISMGDITAQRLRYHPMVRFFGKSSFASLGKNITVGGFPDWEMHYSNCDVFHTSEHGNYLNRKEFPVDFAVWHNADDAAIGKDAVVEKALGWINNLAYTHDITTDKWWYSAGKDSVIVNASIENPNSHQVSGKLYFESLDGSVTDSADLVQMVGKGEVWQGKWKAPGPAENTYWISLKVTDNTDGTSFTSKHATRITTIPLILDSLAYEASSGDKYTFKPYIKNAGTIQKTTILSIHTTSNDSWIKSITPDKRGISAILPGQTKGIALPFTITYDTAIFPGFFNLNFTISSDNWPFWEMDTLTVITGIGDEYLIPLTYSLDQNYPNPFNKSTTFTYKLAESTQVKLQIFNNLGLLVAEPVDEFQQNGEHKVTWNAEGLPAGIYYCRLQAGEQVNSVKIVKMK
jgi:hypothetical protein